MALSRDQVSNLGLGAAVLLATQNIDTRVQAQIAASNAERTTTGNPITGEGLPNPAPVVTRNWGQLPAGRKWGTTAGIDVDPIDGNIWLRRGDSRRWSFDCDIAPLDPIFKFDRKTGAVLASFGKAVTVTPHGIVWIADFAGNKAYDSVFLPCRRGDRDASCRPNPSSPHGAHLRRSNALFASPTSYRSYRATKRTLSSTS